MDDHQQSSRSDGDFNATPTPDLPLRWWTPARREEQVLAENCPDEELAKLYRGLWASEAGHYRAFFEHADDLPPAAEVEQRRDEMLDAEARIIAAQPPGPTMHSGVA